MYVVHQLALYDPGRIGLFSNTPQRPPSPEANSVAAAGTPMASNTGGSGSGGGRRSRGRRLEFGTVDQAEQRGAVKRARVSAGASRSGVSSSGNDRVRTMFRSVLTRYLMGISMGYVEQELLTEAVRSEIVHRVVEKIIGHHQEQIPETENSMEQYIRQNQQKIKECLKGYVEMFW